MTQYDEPFKKALYCNDLLHFAQGQTVLLWEVKMEDEFRKDYLGYKEFRFVNSLENAKENEEILAEIKNKINNEIKNY